MSMNQNATSAEPSRDLQTIQEWMQAVITHPSGVEAGLASAANRSALAVSAAKLETVVLPSRRVSSLQRLRIYANAYYARLLECLRNEFPALVAILGEKTFHAFAFAYLQRYPSTSYTLNDLGRHFPDYLSETQPRGARSDGAAETWPALLVDLARLERMYSEVFSGPGTETLPPLEPTALHRLPAEAWPRLRLAADPALRLARFGFPVHEVVTAARHGEPFTMPAPAETWLVICRREYVVRRHSVSALEFALVERLGSGATLGDALAAVVEEGEPDAATAAARECELADHLADWARRWANDRWFTSVTLADG